MEELEMLPAVSTPAEVFVPYFDESRLHDYLQIAAQLRAAGLGVELYPEPKKLGKQLQYADRRGFRVALVAGEQELAAGQCLIKDLSTGSSTTVALESAADEICRVLGSA